MRIGDITIGYDSVLLNTTIIARGEGRAPEIRYEVDEIQRTRQDILPPMYPLKTNRDVRKLKWQCKVKNVPEKRLPAIVDRAVWEKITKGRAGIRWGNVVEKIWKGETKKRYSL